MEVNQCISLSLAIIEDEIQMKEYFELRYVGRQYYQVGVESELK